VTQEHRGLEALLEQLVKRVQKVTLENVDLKVPLVLKVIQDYRVNKVLEVFRVNRDSVVRQANKVQRVQQDHKALEV
jgi:hypothetical protein